MLRFLTAGESHGQALVVIVEGLPAGLTIDITLVNRELRRRQLGYGRGQRMAIEADEATVLSGIRAGQTIGSPISLLIGNRDWKNWQKTMHVESEAPSDATGALRPPVTRPRPGHADLAGGLKFDRTDLRDVLERASARETAARVAAGALARQLLGAVGIEVVSHVVAVGEVGSDQACTVAFEDARRTADDRPLRASDPELEQRMVEAIDRARAAGDTLGGAFEVIAHGVPPGLGSYTQWDRRLDGLLAQALMSIPAIKAVAIGLGTAVAARPGSQVHDEFVLRPEGDGRPRVARMTNRAGGLEGGVTNGEDVRVTAYMKPISTLMQPLRSIDLATLECAPATVERSDVCAVPAAAVVGEAMTCLVLARALGERFAGDTLDALEASMAAARRRVDERLGRAPDDAGADES